MLSKINQLQSLFKNGLIKVRKEAFNDYFSKYHFYQINHKENLADEIIKQLKTTKTFLINEIDRHSEKYSVYD